MRRILHHSPGHSSTPVLISERAVAGCWFELHRQGGCGAGELRLRDEFPDRHSIHVGDWISFEQTPGDRWYLGRVEHRSSRSPAGTTLRLEGMGVELNEAFPGGFHPNAADNRPPHRYSRTDLFSDDPDHAFETVDVIDQPHDFISLLMSQHVAPRTHITHAPSLIEACDPPVDLVSFKFRGEESVRAIVKDVALRAHAASWGVDALGRFFFLRRRTSVIASFQEGVDLLSLEESSERDLLYNRLALTGDYVYQRTGDSSGGLLQFYRWRAHYIDTHSRAQHGERRLRLWLPWIRTQDDSRAFAREFFRLYGQPPSRYVAEVAISSSTLPVPWGGRFQLRDRNGDPIVTSMVETLRVSFDRTPIMRLELGPEDPHNLWAEPPHDERWEIPGNPLSDFGGSELSLTELSELSSSSALSSSLGDSSSTGSSEISSDDSSDESLDLSSGSSSEASSDVSSDLSSEPSSDHSSSDSSSPSSDDSSDASELSSSDGSSDSLESSDNSSDLSSEDSSSSSSSSELTTTCPMRFAGLGQSTTEQLFGLGEIGWTSPGNITAQDGAAATVAFSSSASSYALVASNFGFSIPEDAVVEGITVRIRRKMDADNTVSDFGLQLRKGGANVGTLPTPQAFTDEWQEVSYGGEEDLWEEAWTPADINASGFGVASWVAGNADDVARVDSIRVTVCYHVCVARTAGAGSSEALQNTGYGDTHWTNPGNVTAEDDAFASVSLIAGDADQPGVYSYALYASSFGFTIPDAATIVGIRLRVAAKNGGSGQQTSYAAISLVDSEGPAGEKNTDGVFLASTVQTSEFLGPSADPLWGASWTPAQINNSAFGAVIWSSAGPTVNGEAHIDRVQIVVCYKVEAAES